MFNALYNFIHIFLYYCIQNECVLVELHIYLQDLVERLAVRVVFSLFPVKLHTKKCIFRLSEKDNLPGFGQHLRLPPHTPHPFPRGSLASGTHTLTHTCPRTRNSFPISGRNEYHSTHSNGISRRSPIGLDQGTSLRCL